MYEFETQHYKTCQRYEDDIARLRQDLQLAQQGSAPIAPTSGPALRHSVTGPGARSLPPYGPGGSFYNHGRRDEPRPTQEDREGDRDRPREMNGKSKTKRIKTSRGG
jgi:hypothetical protein